MNAKVITLDVREDIREGREPFSKIMKTAAGLGGTGKFLLIAPFEPVPLYAVLARQGFGHIAKQNGSGDWEVVFSKEERVSNEPIESPQGFGVRQPSGAFDFASTAPVWASSEKRSRPIGTAVQDAAALDRVGQFHDCAVVEVDARGLEPPQPLIKILEAVESLPVGAELRARTNRRPVHLYPHLEDRGFAARTEEKSDGSFITYIQRH